MSKDRLDLIPTKPLREIAAAFAEGADKYAPWDWRNGRAWRKVHGASMLRHLHAWLEGSDADPQSGVHPLAHLAARAMIVLDLHGDKRYQKFDDRKEVSRGPTRKA